MSHWTAKGHRFSPQGHSICLSARPLQEPEPSLTTVTRLPQLSTRFIHKPVQEAPKWQKPIEPSESQYSYLNLQTENSWPTLASLHVQIHRDRQMGSSFFSKHKLNMQPRTETNYHSLLIFIAMITVTLPSIMPLVMFLQYFKGFFLFISMHFSVIMFIFPRLLKRLRKRLGCYKGLWTQGQWGAFFQSSWISNSLNSLKKKEEEGQGKNYIFSDTNASKKRIRKKHGLWEK